MKFLSACLALLTPLCTLAASQVAISDPVASTLLYFQFPNGAMPAADLDVVMTEVGNELLGIYAESQTKNLGEQQSNNNAQGSSTVRSVVQRDLSNTMDYVFDPDEDLKFGYKTCGDDSDLTQARMTLLLRMTYMVDEASPDHVPICLSGFFREAKSILEAKFPIAVSSVHSSNRVGGDLAFLMKNSEGQEAWDSDDCSLVGDIPLLNDEATVGGDESTGETLDEPVGKEPEGVDANEGNTLEGDTFEDTIQENPEKIVPEEENTDETANEPATPDDLLVKGDDADAPQDMVELEPEASEQTIETPNEPDENIPEEPLEETAGEFDNADQSAETTVVEVDPGTTGENGEVPAGVDTSEGGEGETTVVEGGSNQGRMLRFGSR